MGSSNGLGVRSPYNLEGSLVLLKTTCEIVPKLPWGCQGKNAYMGKRDNRERVTNSEQHRPWVIKVLQRSDREEGS